MEQNRNGYFCNCRPRESVKGNVGPHRRTFRSSFEENRWGGGKKKMTNSGKCSNYFVLFLVAPAESCLDLSDVRTEWNELSH